MRDGAGARQVARTGGVNQPEHARSGVAVGVQLVARETRRARRGAVRWCRAGSIPGLTAGATRSNTRCRPHAPRPRTSSSVRAPAAARRRYRRSNLCRYSRGDCGSGFRAESPNRAMPRRVERSRLHDRRDGSTRWKLWWPRHEPDKRAARPAPRQSAGAKSRAMPRGSGTTPSGA
jgi:hypothetical protein